MLPWSLIYYLGPLRSFFLELTLLASTTPHGSDHLASNATAWPLKSAVTITQRIPAECNTLTRKTTDAHRHNTHTAMPSREPSRIPTAAGRAQAQKQSPRLLNQQATPKAARQEIGVTTRQHKITLCR